MMGRMARFAGSLALLAVVLWWVGAGNVWAQLRDVSFAWLAVALVALTASTFSMARRWQITAQALGLDLPYRSALREYYVALLGNAVLPGGVVGDVGRAIRLRHNGDLSRAAQSVLAERLIGQAAMVLILTSALTIVLILPGGIEWPAYSVLSLTVTLALGLGLVGTTLVLRRTRDFTRMCLHLLAQPIITLHALGAACALIVALYACARATGTVMPFEAVFTILPLVFCAMLVPLSIAGWGWREGAAAALFPLFGATPEAGIAMGLCYGALMIVAALPGAGFVLRAPAAAEVGHA